MSIKYLLEEHQKIYSWKYNNCQNIYMNQYPYVVSVNNEISSFKLKDIEKFVLEITNNTSLESGKAFDILSSTLPDYMKGKLSRLAISHYSKIGLNKSLLHHGYLKRASDLLFKIYRSDEKLN
jgi:hypothetical protein